MADFLKKVIDIPLTEANEDTHMQAEKNGKFERVNIAIVPMATASDAGKFLRVSEDGKWVMEKIANAEGGSF